MLKLLGINLLVLVAYGLLIIVNSSMDNKGFNIAIGMGVCIVIQVILNVVAGITCLIMGKQGPGRSFLLSAVIMVPIGFCSWLILLSIFG